MGRKSDNYQFIDDLYPPADELDTGVAMETSKDKSHEYRAGGWAEIE